MFQTGKLWTFYVHPLSKDENYMCAKSNGFDLISARVVRLNFNPWKATGVIVHSWAVSGFQHWVKHFMNWWNAPNSGSTIFVSHELNTVSNQIFNQETLKIEAVLCKDSERDFYYLPIYMGLPVSIRVHLAPYNRIRAWNEYRMRV